MEATIRSLLLLLLIILFLPSQAQWSQVSSGSTEDLTDVYVVNSATAFVCGDFTILRTTDQGATWVENVPSDFIDSGKYVGTLFKSLWFTDALTGYAVGQNLNTLDRIIFKTFDGGDDWTVIYNGGGWSHFYSDICFVTPQIGYAVGSYGAIYKTTNAGATWVGLGAGTTTARSRIAMVDTSIGYSGGTTRLLKTTNGGSNWNNVKTVTSFDLVFTSADTGFASEINGLIRTADAGASWQPMTINVSSIIVDLFFLNPSLGYANTMGEIYRTDNSGFHWDPQVTTGLTDPLNQTFVLASGFGIAVGDNGLIMKTSNGGGEVIPIAVFTVDANKKCFGDTFFFSNASTPANNPQWSVDGVPQDTTYDFYFVPSVPGIYTVELLNERNGMYDTLEITLTAEDNPISGFTFTTSELSGSFTESSVFGNNYIWDFDDGTIGAGTTIDHTFPSSWEYNVCLNVTNTCGTDTSCQTVNVSINQNEYVWAKTITDPAWCCQIHELYTIRETADNGYIAVGFSNSLGLSGDDPLVVKFDAAGNISWIHAYDALPITNAKGGDILEISPGNYLMLSSDAGGFNLSKLNYRGDVMWVKKYDFIDQYSLVHIERLSNNEILLGGSIDDPLTSNDYDPFFANLDTNGNINWVKTINTTEFDFVQDWHITDNNELIIVATDLATFTEGGRIFRVDLQGNVIWTKRLEIPFFNTSMTTVVSSPSGSIYAVGLTSIYTNGSDVETVVMKLNASGVVQWTKSYMYHQGNWSRTTKGFDIGFTENGKIVIGGSVEHNNTSSTHLWSLDTMGNVLWSNAYDSQGSHRIFNILLADSTIVYTARLGFSTISVEKVMDYGLGCRPVYRRDLWVSSHPDLLTDETWTGGTATLTLLGTDSMDVQETSESTYVNCYAHVDSANISTPISYSYTSFNDCSGSDTSAISFSASGGNYTLSYSIDGGQTFSSDPLFDSLPSGQYSLVVSDWLDTLYGANLNLINSGNFAIDPPNDSTVCSGFQLSVPSGASSYSWQDGSILSTFDVIFTGTYIVTANYGGCVVTDDVVIMVIPSSSVSFSGLDTGYCIDGSPFTVTLAGSPGGGTFSGSGISGNEFNPFSVGAGSYTITYSYLDSNGCMLTSDQSIEVNNCTSIEVRDPGYEITVAPNPSTGEITISFTTLPSKELSLQIFNIIGQQVFADHIVEFTGIYNRKIDLKEESAGVYYMSITTDNHLVKKQVIIR